MPSVKLLTIMYKSQGGNSQYQHGSPHVPLKPSAKRSATPEHMLNDQVHNVTSFTIFFRRLSKLPLNRNVPRWALRWGSLGLTQGWRTAPRCPRARCVPIDIHSSFEDRHVSEQNLEGSEHGRRCHSPCWSDATNCLIARASGAQNPSIMKEVVEYGLDSLKLTI